MSNVGQAALTIVGAGVGFAIGGIPGAQLGYLIGGAAGQAIFPTELPTVRGPKLDNLQVQVSTIGAPIPHLWGRFGAAGNVIWSSGLLPHTTKKKQGGKGAPSQTVESTTYTIDVAVGGPAGVMAGVRRIWADAPCIYDKRPQLEDESDEDFAKRLAATAQIDEILQFYPGTETQLPDPTIESYVGVGNALAYRGLAYIVLTGLDCEPYGKRLPNIVVEWYTDGTAAELDCDEYSPGELYPWFRENRDPRNSANIHYYAGPNDSYTNWHDNIEDARDDGLSGYLVAPINGWSHSTTPNDTLNCQDPSSADYISVYLEVNTIAGGFGYTCDNIFVPGGNVFDPIKAVIGENNLMYSGQPQTGAGGPGLYWFSEGHGSEGGATAEACPVVGMDTGVAGTYADGLFRRHCKETSQEIAVTRSIVPASGCTGGEPLIGAPGFCVIDGVVTRSRTWTQVTSGGFKALQWYEIGTPGVRPQQVTSYPYGPCLRSDDPNYSDEAFWTAAYADALAAGALLNSVDGPIPDDWVYGVDYPLAFSAVSRDVFQASCEGETVTTPCVTVASIVEDVCYRCGLTPNQIDVSDLTSCVEGYIVPQQISGRDILAPLMAFGLFDAVESQGVLKFIERGHAAVRTLDADLDLAAHGSGAQRPTVVETTRQLEESLPQTLRLKYLSPDRDYEQGEQKASRTSVLATDDVTINLPIAMSDDQAARLVDILLTNAWIGRTQYAATTTRAQLPLEPTDNVLLPVDGFLERMRIVESSYSTGGLYQLKLNRDDDGSYTSIAEPGTPAGSGTGAGAGGALVCPVETILLDLPGLRTGDTDAGYYMAARSLCADGFRCAELYRSSDAGDSYVWVGRAANESTIGTVLVADLDGSSPDLLEIELESGGPLESVTDAQLDAGLNLAAVGADGRWLILQYNVATLDSGAAWILQVARSGLFGTAEHLASIVAGDRFVMLSESDLVRIDETPAAIGVAKLFKGVGCGESIDGVDPFTFTTEGLSYVPAAPPSSVISDSESTPPATPADGDCYLVPADTGAVGAWSGHEGEICCFSTVGGGWQCNPPTPGVPIYVDDSGEYVRRTTPAALPAHPGRRRFRRLRKSRAAASMRRRHMPCSTRRMAIEKFCSRILRARAPVPAEGIRNS